MATTYTPLPIRSKNLAETVVHWVNLSFFQYLGPMYINVALHT
jgi:hypothetical protein